MAEVGDSMDPTNVLMVTQCNVIPTEVSVTTNEDIGINEEGFVLKFTGKYPVPAASGSGKLDMQPGEVHVLLTESQMIRLVANLLSD